MNCHQCGNVMRSGDSGEPEYFPGWWCDVCGVFVPDDDPGLDFDEPDSDDPNFMNEDEYREWLGRHGAL